jgi:hypothetical protein
MIIDGYVYLWTYAFFSDPDAPCWFMSFCMETGKMEMLFRRKYNYNILIYFLMRRCLVIG